MTDANTNAEMIRLWNEVQGPRWLALQDRLDMQLDAVGLAAMARLSLAVGARVLDVGCGAGSTTLELARRVGPGGSVTGVDISAPLLGRAVERAAATGIANARFVRDDAQTYAFESGSFDVIFSRFGVMFFDDPVAAFANLRRALAPGGVMVFICWRAARENAWVSVPMTAALPFFSELPAPTPGAPGPFGLAERERLEAILESAGFAEVSLEAYDTPLYLGGNGDLDATVEFTMQIGPTAALLRDHGSDRIDDVRAALREALAAHQTADGITLASATWIVRASG